MILKNMLESKRMNQPSYAIKKIYSGTFENAVTTLTQALKEQGFGVLTQINVKETLKRKLEVDYPSYIILGVCNPPNAYKALQAEKEIGLLLPCNVIIYEENGTVSISVMKPTAALTLSKNASIAKIAQEVESKLTIALKKTITPKRS